MTRRSSVRANAREIYRDLMKAEEAAQTRQESALTPDLPSLCFGQASPSPRAARARGGGERKAPPAARGETELTARVRALYEQKAVPVREIAAIAGVSERTIYKYVARHGWRRRYLVMPRGWATAPVADRGRGVRSRGAAPAKRPGKSGIKRQARDRLLEPIKGAGGRFVRREDRHKPFASGLKATDPAGAARAVARSGKAARLAAYALAEAEFARCSATSLEALIFAIDALEKHINYRSKHGITDDRPRGVDAVDDALHLAYEMAADARDAAAKEKDAAFRAWMALPKA